MKVTIETDPEPDRGTNTDALFSELAGRVARDPQARYVYMTVDEYQAFARYMDDLFGHPDPGFVVRRFMGKEVKQI